MMPEAISGAPGDNDDAMSAASGNPEEMREAAMIGKGYLMFNTSNFLSTASAFAFGSGGGGNNNSSQQYGLRKRTANAHYGNVAYAPLLGGRMMPRTDQLKLMPHYTNMLKTGTPIARHSYRLIIKVSVSF